MQRIGCLRMRRRRALCSNFRRGARKADVELEGRQSDPCAVGAKNVRVWVAEERPIAFRYTRLPDGQITCAFSHTASQASLRKIFRFGRRANQWFLSARLTRQEGRLAIVTNARSDAVDVDAPADNRA